MANIHCNHMDGLPSRRDLLKTSAKGVFLGACGMTLADKLFMNQVLAEAGPIVDPWYDGFLYVFFGGGPSQTDTWDVKPGSINQNPNLGTINLGVNDVYNKPINISDVFPNIANHVMTDPMVSLGLVRSFDHGSNNHGNGQAMMGSFWQGQLLNVYPSIAPAMAWMGDNFPRPGQIAIPSVVLLGNNPQGVNDARGARVPTALEVNVGNNQGGNPVVEALSRPAGVDADRYARRKALLDSLNARFKEQTPGDLTAAYQNAIQQAYDVTAAGQAAGAFDLTGKTLLPSDNNGEAQRFTVAQELLKAGVPYVTMGIGGNDSHGNNTATIRSNWGASFDAAIGQLITNVKATGKKILIMAAGDFGRTPDVKGNGYQNGDDGRDHWGDSFSVAMISVNQPKFKTNALGDTGPDGLFTVNRTSRNGVGNNSLVDPINPAGLGWFVYSLMLGPTFTLGMPDGTTDIPTATGRNAPLADRTIALSATNNQAAKMFSAFFP